VVTGLHAGLGLMLGAVAVSLMAGNWLIALLALAFLSLSFVWTRGPWALLVVVAGVLLAPSVATELPVVSAESSGVSGVLSGVLAQLPLTLLNAVVVTAAVARSLFPEDQTVNERRLAVSSGMLNLISVPFGAMPMCHGAGGLTAHYRFGARGAGAPLVMAMLCGVAAWMGPEVIGLLSAIPIPVVGALLAYAAADLVISRRMFDARPDCRPVIAAAAFATFFWGALAGLVAGLAAETVRVQIKRRTERA
jgi:MFS superfamily sulfate permease-like transporter